MAAVKAAQEKAEAEEEVRGIKQEHEDLMVLLADQDSKLDAYKARLKELGEKVSLWATEVILNSSW